MFGAYYPAQAVKESIPNVAIATILATSAGQRKFAGFFAHLGTVHRWNLRILREQDEIAAFFADRKARDSIDGIIYSGRYDGNIFKTLATLPCPVVVMGSESPELARRLQEFPGRPWPSSRPWTRVRRCRCRSTSIQPQKQKRRMRRTRGR